MLMQMVHILQDTQFPGHDDIVDGAEMLGVFGQPDAAGMWHDGDVEFLGHEQHGEDLVDAAEAAGVDLADVDGARLQELLEDHAVLAHLAGGDADAERGEGFADGGVAEHVVGRSRLFDKPGLKFGQVLHVGDCFGDGPDLVGVDH